MEAPANHVTSNENTMFSIGGEEIEMKIEKCAVNTARYRNLKDIPQGFCQQTDEFYDPSDEAVKWSLQLYANGYPSTDPNSVNDTVGLRMVYHGQEKVVARFLFEVCRNREEFRNQIPTFLKKETTNIPQGFCQQTDEFYDPSDETVKWSLQLYANGYPSTDPNSMNNAVGIRIIYHGQEKIVARFVFEICRNREEFRDLIPTLLKKETS
uniref:Uncharacterized protein n=1 Tax=Panagrolaimus sp. ES5 TaxID=591445 RepID=A0AC34GCJ8_9BILA